VLFCYVLLLLLQVLVLPDCGRSTLLLCNRCTQQPPAPDLDVVLLCRAAAAGTTGGLRILLYGCHLLLEKHVVN
jgi:hypothetical protein